MYKNVICASLLIMFLGFQLASANQCYTCTSQDTCKNPRVVTCTDAAANATRNELLPIVYGNLPNGTSGSYECVNVTASNISINQPQKWIAGCLFKNIDFCKAMGKLWSAYTYTSCNSCNNLCKNPASTFSNSLITIFTSIFGLVFYKIFVTA